MTATDSSGLATLTIPGPDPQGRPRRHARRAGLVRSARQDERRAASIFVGGRGQTRQALFPKDGTVHERARRNAREHAGRNADVSQSDRAAERTARLEEMAGLQPEKGDGRRRLHRDAADLARRPVEAGGDIDSEHPAALLGEGVDPLNERSSFPVEIAGESGAEEAVDHAVRSLDIEVGGRQDRALKPRRRERRVAPQRRQGPQ